MYKQVHFYFIVCCSEIIKVTNLYRKCESYCARYAFYDNGIDIEVYFMFGSGDTYLKQKS